VPRRIVLEFVDEGVSAVAELLEEQAPMTCAAVLELLPQLQEANHAVYSGSEVAYLLDRYVVIPRENSTTKVIPGDVAYTYFEGGVYYGIPEGFSELCWFYDRDAVPSMPDGPVPVNIFARIVEGADLFYAVCRRMRREGNKRVAVRLAE
jgi:hypothetical protein